MTTKNGEQNGQPPSSEEAPRGGRPALGASDAALERFAKSFESSARRWELIVYPSLFAFIILAAYGFFLIYSLTQDMHTLAERMDPSMGQNMSVMAARMSSLSVNIETMSDNISEMTLAVDEMNTNLAQMNSTVAVMETEIAQMRGHTDLIQAKLDTLEPMLLNIAAMNQSMQVMRTSTGVMSRDMNRMTYDVMQMGRPMSFINQFFPW